MHSGKKLLSASLLSVLDQGMLSALNFAIGMLLIRLLSKEAYGVYGQLYAAGLLVGLIVDSWISGPLTTVAPTVDVTTRQGLLRAYWAKQVFWVVCLAGVAGALVHGVPAVTHGSMISPWLGVAFAASIAGNGVREYGRTTAFIEGQIGVVLRQDVLYVMAVTLGLGVLAWREALSLLAVFWVLAAAAGICALGVAVRMARLPASAAQTAAHHGVLQSHGRWAVLGVIVGWLSNYSYIYLSGAWLGVAAIADLNAARLLLMPIPLMVAAWSRVARPEASRLMAAQEWRALRRLTLLSVLAVEGLVLVYVAALLFALPVLEAQVLGSKYRGLDGLILLWGGYFAVNAARWIGTSWLSSGGAYRAMFFLGTTTLALVLGVAAWAMPRYGAAGAIFALICVEGFELAVVWRFILPRVRQRLSGAN